MLENFTVMDGGEQTSDMGKGDENLGDYILEDLDDYFDDIDGRLTISRMVSDSVIRGMVKAVEQEANERIAQRDVEVLGLKEMLHIYHVGTDETKMPGSSVVYHAPFKVAAPHFSCTEVEHGRLIESVESVQDTVNKQLKQLKIELYKTGGIDSIRRTSSGSELVGLGGILQEKVPERWINVHKAFESLKATLDTFCRKIQMMAQSSNAPQSEWQKEQEYRFEIEGMVIANCLRSLQEEYEQKLWDQSTLFCDPESGNCYDILKDISSLCQELDSIVKTISVNEGWQLTSHGSLENGEEWCNNKRNDNIHRKLSTKNSSPSTMEGNDKHEDSKISKPEQFDPGSLKHMPSEELITYYNSEITKMRRNHESQVQEMTEENFRLRGELLRVRGSSLPLKKDKDFDTLRKKIPDVVSKLDKILSGNDVVLSSSETNESLSSLKDRLESLEYENHQLRDKLMVKKRKSKNLSSQLSDALEKLSQQQKTEKKLLQTIQKLEGNVGDTHTEVSVIQDVYECLIQEMTCELRCIAEEIILKHNIMEDIYKIICKEAAHNGRPSSQLEIEDSDMELIIIQGLLTVIFNEVLIDAEKEALKLDTVEKEKRKQEMLMLMSMMQEKEKLAEDAADSLAQEKKKMELASEELKSLRTETVQQEKVISESNKKLEVIKGELADSLKEVELYKEEICKLHQNLELEANKLKEIDEERRVLRAVTQEKQDALTVIETKERETRKQMESTIVFVNKLLTAGADFESRVNQHISGYNSRLKDMSSEFHCLNNKINTCKAIISVYEQRLETRCSDLAKAEAEVDLLGDDVDTLLSLLEKIYIGLDHYSPVLRHYPGITEILELVRRELSGESRKPVRSYNLAK